MENYDAVSHIHRLLNVSEGAMISALTTRTIVTPSESYTVPLKVDFFLFLFLRNI